MRWRFWLFSTVYSFACVYGVSRKSELVLIMESKAGDKEEIFNEFIKEVSKIEQRDSVYTSEKQIQRLLRPGSSYANLNPFGVLMVDYDATPEEVRKQYKKLSILLHPDKNLDNREKAQTAFDVLNKAYKSLEDDKTRARAMEVVEEAKFKVNQTMEEKRKKLKREGKKGAKIDEDDPEKYKHALDVMVMKLFADYERRRRALEARDTQERKRQREEEIEEEQRKKDEKEWNKNYEESREVRVSSWKQFAGKTKKFKGGFFKPPKHRPESK